MSMHHFTAAKITFGGKTLAFGSGTAEVHEPRATERARALIPPVLTFDAVVEGPDALSAFTALLPATTPAVFLRVPWGILGNIDVHGYVEGHRIRQDAEGTRADFEIVPDERVVRRALSVAVQRAILRPAGVMERLFNMSKDPDLRRRARKIARLGRYHGERKRRKAMRRLLRAAGLTKSRLWNGHDLEIAKAARAAANPPHVPPFTVAPLSGDVARLLAKHPGWSIEKAMRADDE